MPTIAVIGHAIHSPTLALQKIIPYNVDNLID